ncbi:hypothetical protein BBJ28_00007632 [Nothophytophthora sp. Chile5]|nr:hypothetical protein BBJ28_00007632 [Nothophytophthora sp. Chile5]
MIANPGLKAYRYDPYPKVLTIEKYDLPQMMKIRRAAIDQSKSAKKFGIVLGTLGRQGNPTVLDRVKKLLGESGKEYFVLLLSELFPDKPLLSPYEAEVCLGQAQWTEGSYPMDFYAKGSGAWTNYHEAQKQQPSEVPV